MIKIIDGWYYEVDELQYTLIHIYECEKMKFGTKEKTGEIKTVRSEIGYFRNLELMLIRVAELIAKEKVAAGEITTIREHIQELKNIKSQLSELVKPF